MIETLLYKNISLILFSKKAHWDRWRNIYSEEGLLLVPYLLPGAWGANTCTPLYRIVRDDLTPLIGCISLAQLPILCTLSKYDRVVLINWSPSGYTPGGPDCLDALSFPCLLITTWQLVKTDGVTRNEPKNHVICYITLGLNILWSTRMSDQLAFFHFQQSSLRCSLLK